MRALLLAGLVTLWVGVLPAHAVPRTNVLRLTEPTSGTRHWDYAYDVNWDRLEGGRSQGPTHLAARPPATGFCVGGLHNGLSCSLTAACTNGTCVGGNNAGSTCSPAINLLDDGCACNPPGTCGMVPASLWEVDDCASPTCTTGGGVLHCLTKVRDDGSVWDVLQCDPVGVFCKTLEAPNPGDLFTFWMSPSAGAISSIDCRTDAATSVQLTLETCNGNAGGCVNVNTTPVTCTQTTSGAGLVNPAYAANGWWKFLVGAVAGTPGKVEFCLQTNGTTSTSSTVVTTSSSSSSSSSSTTSTSTSSSSVSSSSSSSSTSTSTSSSTSTTVFTNQPPSLVNAPSVLMDFDFLTMGAFWGNNTGPCPPTPANCNLPTVTGTPTAATAPIPYTAAISFSEGHCVGGPNNNAACTQTSDCNTTTSTSTTLSTTSSTTSTTLSGATTTTTTTSTSTTTLPFPCAGSDAVTATSNSALAVSGAAGFGGWVRFPTFIPTGSDSTLFATDSVVNLGLALHFNGFSNRFTGVAGDGTTTYSRTVPTFTPAVGAWWFIYVTVTAGGTPNTMEAGAFFGDSATGHVSTALVNMSTTNMLSGAGHAVGFNPVSATSTLFDAAAWTVTSVATDKASWCAMCACGKDGAHPPDGGVDCTCSGAAWVPRVGGLAGYGASNTWCGGCDPTPSACNKTDVTHR